MPLARCIDSLLSALHERSQLAQALAQHRQEAEQERVRVTQLSPVVLLLFACFSLVISVLLWVSDVLSHDVLSPQVSLKRAHEDELARLHTEAATLREQAAQQAHTAENTAQVSVRCGYTVRVFSFSLLFSILAATSNHFKGSDTAGGPRQVSARPRTPARASTRA